MVQPRTDEHAQVWSHRGQFQVFRQTNPGFGEELLGGLNDLGLPLLQRALPGKSEEKVVQVAIQLLLESEVGDGWGFIVQTGEASLELEPSEESSAAPTPSQAALAVAIAFEPPEGVSPWTLVVPLEIPLVASQNLTHPGSGGLLIRGTTAEVGDAAPAAVEPPPLPPDSLPVPPPLERRAPLVRERRTVRVFVSSTFHDMHAERDELAKRAFPELRHRCRSLGIDVIDVDLRWGVTTENSDVLEVCLAEVDRCRPYFVGIIGERYGEVPEDFSPEVLRRHPWLEDHRDRSMTELEVMHGALRKDPRTTHALFYFRAPRGSAPEEPRIRDLKSRIRAAGFQLRASSTRPARSAIR